MGKCIIFCAAGFETLAEPIGAEDLIIAADGGLRHTEKGAVSTSPFPKIIRPSLLGGADFYCTGMGEIFVYHERSAFHTFAQ